jgi:hypothetical protein
MAESTNLNQLTSTLQTDRRRHAGTVSDFRKNLLKVRKLIKDILQRAH